MSPLETTNADYKNLIDLLALHSEAKQRLAALELDAQGEFTIIVDGVRAEYTAAQAAVTESDAAIRALAEMHPEWFAGKKTVKTPYGSVSLRKTTKLEVRNEEATILLIERQGAEAEAKYVRSEKTLNLEALEQLTDAELKALRIVRVTDDSITIKEAKIDLGKAVRAETGSEVAA